MSSHRFSMSDEIKNTPYYLSCPKEFDANIADSWLSGLTQTERDIIINLKTQEKVIEWLSRTIVVRNSHLSQIHDRLTNVENENERLKTQLSTLKARLRPYLIVGGSIGAGTLAMIASKISDLLK